MRYETARIILKQMKEKVRTLYFMNIYRAKVCHYRKRLIDAFCYDQTISQ